MNTVALVITGKADLDDVSRGLDDVGDSAKAMARDVDKATAGAESSGRRMAGLGTQAENLDDKFGKATGSLGALSAGFELVGLEKYAGGLQAAAMATDFASGAGQALNLILGLESAQRAKAVVQAGAHTAATIAQSGAAKAAAAGQFVLNAALSANPIGLVVAAIALLVAGLLLAYNKSETFRAVVQTVGAVGKEAIGYVVDKVGDLVGLVRDKAGPVVGGLGDAFSAAKAVAVGALDAIRSPIDYVVDKVQGLLDLIGKVKIPGNPLGFTLDASGAPQAYGAAPGDVLYGSGYGPRTGRAARTSDSTVLVLQAIDPRELVRVLRREGFIVGTPR